jgi:hypothetical protein
VTPHDGAACDADQQTSEYVRLLPGRPPNPPFPHELLDAPERRLVDDGWPLSLDQLTSPAGAAARVRLADVRDVAEHVDHRVRQPAMGGPCSGPWHPLVVQPTGQALEVDAINVRTVQRVLERAAEEAGAAAPPLADVLPLRFARSAQEFGVLEETRP